MRGYRHDSEFGLGPSSPMTKTQKEDWLVAVNACRHKHGISANGIILCDILQRYLGRSGHCYLSHTTMASLVGCSISTIKKQLGLLKKFGLITWTHRLKRIGASVEQTSNAYTLRLPQASTRAVVAEKSRGYYNKYTSSPLGRFSSLNAARVKHIHACMVKAKAKYFPSTMSNQRSGQCCSAFDQRNYEDEAKTFSSSLRGLLTRQLHWNSNGGFTEEQAMQVEHEVAHKLRDKQCGLLREVSLQPFASRGTIMQMSRLGNCPERAQRAQEELAAIRQARSLRYLNEFGHLGHSFSSTALIPKNTEGSSLNDMRS